MGIWSYQEDNANSSTFRLQSVVDRANKDAIAHMGHILPRGR